MSQPLLPTDPNYTTPEPDLAPPVQQPGIFDLAFLTGIVGASEIYLVRHAQQDIDPAGPVGTMVDPPLSEKGLVQAEAAGRALSGVKLDAIYCSPLRRARDTAAAIARHYGIEPVLVRDLREVEIWRDMPQDQSVRDFLGVNYLQALRERMIVEKTWDVYPYSESSFEFRRRCVNAVEAALAGHPGERIAVVCHGGVINAYTGHVVGTPYDMWFRPAHASISLVVAAHGRRALRSINSVHHLQADGLETY